MESTEQHRDKLNLAIADLDHTLRSVSQLRDGVKKLFGDCAIAQSPEDLQKRYKENYMQVQKLQSMITELASKLHPVLCETDGKRQGLLNADKKLLPEGVLPADAPFPATAAALHEAYTWERQVQYHGAFASATFAEELAARFPALASNTAHAAKENLRIRDVDDSIMWISALQPPMEVTKVYSSGDLSALKVSVPGAFVAHVSLQPLGIGSNRCVRANDVRLYATDEETWLHSYHTLFTDKCEGCLRHLQHESEEERFLPPIVRTFRVIRGKHQPYHTRCLPSSLLE